MRLNTARSIVAVACLAIGATQASAAQPRIELEVAMQPGVPITAPQEWARRLGSLDLASVKIRSARGDDQPRVSLDDAGRVQVLAMLTPRNELVLPKKRFRAGDLASLKKYFEELPLRAAEGDADRGRFGLTEAEFREVHAALSKSLGLSTVGKTTAELLQAFEAQAGMPVKQAARAIAPLRTGKPLEVELQSFATGTLLAIALRREGLALRPEKPLGEPLQFVVEPLQTEREKWPVGWKSPASPRQVAPRLFESLSIEIDGYTMATALEALTPRFGVPVILDEWVLAEQDLRPDETEVSLPRRKTFLKNALDVLLSQAHLAGELRVDEEGNGFLWITQYGKHSRPASK